MVNADTDPPGVAGEIVDPVGNGLAARRNQEVVDADRRGAAFRSPLASGILEVADQFLLLRIDGDHGLRGPLAPPDVVIDVPELRIAVRVVRAFARLSVGLQTVARRREEFGDQLPADRVAQALERRRQVPHTLVSRVGSFSSVFLRPPPGRRIRSGATDTLDVSSLSPRWIVA